MYIKIGAVSFNTKNKKINFDRRTIKGQPVWKHVAYVAGGVLATAGLAAVMARLG